MNAWSRLTDKQLIKIAREQAAAQARVAAMPKSERTKIGKKGEVSPDQGVALNLWVLIMVVDELQRRGVNTDEVTV